MDYAIEDWRLYSENCSARNSPIIGNDLRTHNIKYVYNNCIKLISTANFIYKFITHSLIHI